MITRTIVALLGYMCVAGFVANGQTLTCNSTNPCPSNQQCTMSSWGGSQCNWGTCNCASAGMKINSTTCVTPTVNVGGGCAFNSDCKGLYTYCNTTNQCACLTSSYTVKSDNSDCIPPTPPAKTPLNSNCTSASVCGQYAWCNTIGNNTCQCLPNNYAPVGGSNNFDCTPQPANVTAGGMCTTNNQYCVTGLTCGKCPESSTYTCQTAPITTTTTSSPGGGSGGGASNVRLDIMALVAALAFICFA